MKTAGKDSMNGTGALLAIVLRGGKYWVGA
jgi:hypothetical protein